MSASHLRLRAHGERVLIIEEVPERRKIKRNKGWKDFDSESETMPRPAFATDEPPLLFYGWEMHECREAYELGYWRAEDGDKPFWCDPKGDPIEHGGWVILSWFPFPPAEREV